MEWKDVKIAFVYDKVVTWGGAERLLLLLHEIFPTADLFTSIYDRQNAGWSEEFCKIYTTKLSTKFFKKKYHWSSPFLNLAFEGFNFSSYDLVISVTSYSAKSIITKPRTCHICYCLTPDRYLWFETIPPYNLSTSLGKLINAVERLIRPMRRVEDQLMATRPDYYLTISKKVAGRIKKYYRREAKVLYPGINTKYFVPSNKPTRDYFVVVGRMTAYKLTDMVLRAFRNSRENLVVVGDGSMMKNLASDVTNNVKFTGYVSDSKLREIYQNAKALIAIQEEDFGLVVLEALACGIPVIINGEAGASELVNPRCGIKIYNPTVDKIKNAIDKYASYEFNSKNCRDVALKYDNQIFVDNFENAVKKLYIDYTDKLNK